MADRLLTLAEAAARLSVSTKTVRRLVYARKLRGRPRGLGKQRPGLGIPESSLDAYIRGPK
ncbi:helix-turn-helix domain-containing protein [Plantactinospora sp. WMMB334]|uniref:helix-turn-helix domain-containing protein n=1 Tax=Plantactinospora sp. WMMB334 TaxID=3404119 RepID=UPI003B964D4F